MKERVVTLQVFTHAGVLPYRVNGNKLEFLLITGRGSRQWLIPKGHWRPGGHPSETALREAYEEAGLTGTIHPQPIGTYRNGNKRNRNKQELIIIYPLEVRQKSSSWPEKGQRKRKWVDAAAAGDLVDDTLADIIKSFARNFMARAHSV
jgi:8-oxo-dGTP pyrophosphatase MutT (NUDIX family)